MSNDIRFSPRASLTMAGRCMQQMGIWKIVGQHVTTWYDEIVVERLYRGKVQLNRSLQGLVTEAEQVLNLNLGFRRRTVIRTDAGSGRDEDINWLLNRHYASLTTKVTNRRRVANPLESVTLSHSHTDPKDCRRRFGWVEQPHAYDQPTRQLVIRRAKKDGSWSTHVLVCNLSEDVLLSLTSQVPDKADPCQVMLVVLCAHDQRGGEDHHQRVQTGIGFD